MDEVKSNLQSAYNNLMSDPKAPNWAKIELRSIINRLFRGTITNVATGPGLGSPPDSGSNFKPFKGDLFGNKKKSNSVPAAAVKSTMITPDVIAPAKEADPSEMDQIKSKIKELGGKFHPKATLETLKKIHSNLLAEQQTA